MTYTTRAIFVCCFVLLVANNYSVYIVAKEKQITASFMATKKAKDSRRAPNIVSGAVKKVEIADDTVLNLKHKKREEKAETGNEIPVSFNVHRINELSKERQVEDNSVRSEGIMDRTARAPIETREVGIGSEVTETERSGIDQEELHKRMESFAEKLERAVIKVAPQENSNTPSYVAAEPKELIKVKFEKFVQLVATKDFFSVLERNKNEDIVMSSNLLTELASAVEEKGEKKSPVIFLVGLAIGVIVTYLLINR